MNYRKKTKKGTMCSFFVVTNMLWFLFSCSSGEEKFNLELISGQNQQAFQNEQISDPIILRVSDNEGNPISGVELEITQIIGGGEVTFPSSSSDNEGIVSLLWTLGDDRDQSCIVSIKGDKESIQVRAKSKYTYKKPAQSNDNWEIGELDVSSPETMKILAGIDQIRDEKYTEIHSFLIVHDKKLVFEEYFPGRTSNGIYTLFDKDIKHEIQSASKSFRSLLIGIAIENNFINSVDKKLFSFFPEYVHLKDTPEKDEITLDHILTMSSGLQWSELDSPYGSPQNDLSTMYGLASRNDWAPYILNKPIQYTPGETFVYNTGASLMLADIITNSIDMNRESFTQTYYSNLVEGNPTNNPFAGAMTPREMAKLGYIYLYEGKWKNTQIISKNWIEKSTTERFSNLVNGHGYGYQWWIGKIGNEEVFYANGNGGQFIIIFRDLDLAIISTAGHFGSTKMYDIFSMIETHVIPAFRN